MHPETLAGALERLWLTSPDRPALVAGGRVLTHGDLGAAIQRLADVYRDLGIGRGDRVLCHLPNRPEFVVGLGAAWARGAVHVGADRQLTGAELCQMIEITGASALLTTPDVAAADPYVRLRPVRQRHPETHLLVLDGGAGLDGALPLGDVLRGEPGGRPHPGPEPADPGLIFVTSGTTGRPKAPMGFQANLRGRWLRQAGELGFGPDDVHLVHLPLTFGFGLMMALSGLLAGGRLVLVPRFSVDETLRLVESERVTVLNGSSTHFRLVLGRLREREHDASSLRVGVGSAAAFPVPLIRSILDDLRLRFMLMYGSSEGVGVTTMDREDMLLGAVGRPAPGSVAIVDEERRPAPPGQAGEIAFSRAVFPVRYWGEAGQAGAALERLGASADEAGWYHSGDRGRFDEEGRLYVLGRVAHQINRGGLKIDPVEVESALRRCPDVADAAVIGLPNAVVGETVCACVVPKPGTSPELEPLRSLLGQVLATYKLPEELAVREDLPRTQVGKLDLERLRTEVMAGARQRRAG